MRRLRLEGELVGRVVDLDVFIVEAFGCLADEPRASRRRGSSVAIDCNARCSRLRTDLSKSGGSVARWI